MSDTVLARSPSLPTTTAAAGAWSRLFATDTSNKILLGQRLLLAAVMFPHGAQKLFGWFGGGGFDGTMAYLTGPGHLPWIVALLVVLAESIGAIALAAGAFSRVAALGIVSVMVGAVATVHLPHGFFMNWFGNQAGEGFEYHLLVLALAVPILVAGGGKWAVDSVIARRAGR